MGLFCANRGFIIIIYVSNVPICYNKNVSYEGRLVFFSSAALVTKRQTI